MRLTGCSRRLIYITLADMSLGVQLVKNETNNLRVVTSEREKVLEKINL